MAGIEGARDELALRRAWRDIERRRVAREAEIVYLQERRKGAV